MAEKNDPKTGKVIDKILLENKFLKMQMESSLDGILVVSPEGEHLLSNNRFKIIWKISPDILDTKDDQKILQYVLGQLKNPEEFIDKVTYLYQHPVESSQDEIKFLDGRCLDRYSVPLTDFSGQYCGRVWYFRDITESKKIEESLNNYVNIINHDLCSPISNIIGCSSMVISDVLSKEETSKFMEIINNSAKKMLKMIETYLVLAKVEVGNNEIIKKAKTIIDVANEIREIFIEVSNKRNKLVILFNNSENNLASDVLQKSIYINETLISAMFLNLLNNAIEASDKINNEITVNVYEKEACVFFEFTNSGEVPESIRGNLMNKFVSSKKRGTGLGLYSAKLIARAHDGDLSYQPLTGYSRFTFEIPYLHS